MSPTFQTRDRSPLEALLSLLDLEKTGENHFRGYSQPALNGRIFGGLVFAQAMTAAQATAGGRPIHSAHAYFLRPGNPDLPIDYEIDCVRDGRSFHTRGVIARQGEPAIFDFMASFHENELSPVHELPVEIPAEPAGEEYEAGILRAIRARGIDFPAEKFGQGPVQILVEGGLEMTDSTPRKPDLRAWLRARGPMPDDPARHAAVLGYVSDLLITVGGAYPFDFRLMSPGVSTASLDHAMWFHEPPKVDDWIYVVHDSPVFKGSRVMGRALFYARDGRLVASAVQEGLVRNENWPGASSHRHRPNVKDVRGK
jgi:acyl-CoA thioesterase-2